jgi:hypothetical protein
MLASSLEPDGRLLDAYSGSADVDAVVTAFVLAAIRASISRSGIGRTDSSAMGRVRAFGELRDSRAFPGQRPPFVLAGVWAAAGTVSLLLSVS